MCNCLIKLLFNVAPTDVVHGDGADLDVKAGDLGRCVHQNIGNLGVGRDGRDKCELEVGDD